MTISALTQQPRLGDAKPLALVRTGREPASIHQLLGVSLDDAQPVGEQILSALTGSAVRGDVTMLAKKLAKLGPVIHKLTIANDLTATRTALLAYDAQP